MRYFANILGFEKESDFWGMVGLLHDIDYEMWPDEHCKKAVSLLKDANFSDKFIHAVVCHSYNISSDVKPACKMEKILYTIDELTGIINAARLVRPDKSYKDMKLKSLKKKFKSEKFAQACNREVIKNGAESLGVDLDWILSNTLEAFKLSEEKIDKEMETMI